MCRIFAHKNKFFIAIILFGLFFPFNFFYGKNATDSKKNIVKNCVISTDNEKLQIDKLKEMFKDLNFAKKWSEEEIQTVIDNSDMCFGLYGKDGTQIGFARVLTDYVMICNVYSVVIDKNYRGLGLGKKIMKNIMSHEKLQKCLFEVNPSGNAIKFYKKLGFTYFRNAHMKYRN